MFNGTWQCSNLHYESTKLPKTVYFNELLRNQITMNCIMDVIDIANNSLEFESTTPLTFIIVAYLSCMQKFSRADYFDRKLVDSSLHV